MMEEGDHTPVYHLHLLYSFFLIRTDRLCPSIDDERCWRRPYNLGFVKGATTVIHGGATSDGGGNTQMVDNLDTLVATGPFGANFVPQDLASHRLVWQRNRELEIGKKDFGSRILVMQLQVKLDTAGFEDIKDDLDFCVKLAKEESVMILLGLQNRLWVTFAIDPSYLEDNFKKLESFCERHSKSA